jgi:UDP-glucose:(heptosyl)LPS alpha-1,3-glucosyltransferase
MKTILISQKDLHATRSGVPRKVLEETKYFAQKGHKVYAIAERIDNEKVKEAGGNPVKTFRWPISGFFRRKFYMNRFESFAKKVKPDLIIGHGDIIKQDLAYIHNCVHLAYELIHGKKIPSDHEVAKIHEEILKGQKFKALVCNSQMMKDDLTQRFYIPAEKAHVIYPEYNPNVFNTDQAEKLRSEVRTKLGLGEQVVVGLITSGNFKKRNVSLLIDAVSALPQELRGNLKVIIAGKDKADKYIEQAKVLGIDQLFTFLPSINAVHEYYHAIDIFVLPALIEEFGRSVLEAMGCGKPVIVSKTVGSSEILEENQRNYILHDITVSELTHHLKDLIASKELRDSLGQMNAQVAKKYSDQAQNDKFHELLIELGYTF